MDNKDNDLAKNKQSDLTDTNTDEASDAVIIAEAPNTVDTTDASGMVITADVSAINSTPDASDIAAPDSHPATSEEILEQFLGDSSLPSATGSTLSDLLTGQTLPAVPDVALVDGALLEEVEPLPIFEPISEERIKKAKRTRTVLIVVIILLVLASLGAGAGAAYIYLNQETAAKVVEKPDTAITTTVEDNKLQDRGTVQVTETPNLVQLFGKTSEEALDLLGSEYTLAKTEEITEQDSPDVKKLTTMTYTPADKQSGAAVGSTQTQNIYLSLNAEGQTIEVYFVSSIDLLGYPIQSFAELTASKESVTKAIQEAGATVAEDFSFKSPTTQEATQYVDPEAKEKKVKKETATFNGKLQSEALPKDFSLTFTYDYGASGVPDTSDKKPSQRTIYLKLR